MRIFKHGLLNMVRRPTKAIMIFIIMFVVFGLVFTGVIVENSILESKNYIRREIGGVVEYKVDYMSAWSDELDQEDYEDLVLSLDLAEEMSKDSLVEETYITEQGYVDSEVYKMAKEVGSDEDRFDIEGYEDYAWFTIKGTKGNEPIEFSQNQVVLLEGEMVGEKSKETDIMISDALAARNNLAVGDTMTFLNWMNQEEVEMKIIGLFQVKETASVNDIYSTFSMAKLFSGMEANTASAVYFMIDDPLNIPQFIEKNENKLPSKYTYLDAGDSQFDTLTRPLDLMGIISSILIWVIFIAGALIIIAIVTIFVRDRKFEVGLLLASGESKGKIVLQFVSEILIVAILAFIVALAISNQTSGMVGHWIVENQLVEEDTRNEDIYYYDGMTNVHGEVSMEDVADEFDVSLNGNVILSLSALSLFIVLFAACIPLIVIISYKPRRALQD